MLNIIPWYYRLVALVIISTGCFFFGMDYQKGREAKKAVTGLIEARKQDKKTVEAISVVEKKHEETAAKVQIVYRTITKEVIKYAESPAGQSVGLDPEFVRLHNAAAVPDDPAASGEAATAAWSPTNAEALTTIQANYEQCNQWRELNLLWQDWYLALPK